MAIRLALAGAVLIVVGALDLGGVWQFTVTAGALALAASGIMWLTARRGGSS
ncbi:hypothetical protein [Actinomadura darangshiensis]|uniref:hypothetical protein n=1 Tax=Actinomadura darangshiensis TaxID=705336 RepID=UPI0014087DCC|nr:hypothetical protein [Actinomadura darangshiensis]